MGPLPGHLTWCLPVARCCGPGPNTKYGILNEDTYNFDETGFIIGIIMPSIVVTTLDGRSRAK